MQIKNLYTLSAKPLMDFCLNESITSAQPYKQTFALKCFLRPVKQSLALYMTKISTDTKFGARLLAQRLGPVLFNFFTDHLAASVNSWITENYRNRVI